MTLFTICQKVLDETGWQSLTTIASNQEPTARQLFSICNTVVEDLVESYNWPQLETDWDFSTVAGQSEYALPSDFNALLHNSLFNKDEYYRLKGSQSIEDWRLRKEGLLGSLDKFAFRLGHTAAGAPIIRIAPTPDSARDLVLTYISSNPIRGADGNTKPAFTLDDDVCRLPEKLVKLGAMWRFRRAKGIDFSVELAEFNAATPVNFARKRDMGDIAVGGKRFSDGIGVTDGYVRESGFGV